MAETSDKTVIEYKCPCCNAGLKYDSKTGEMVCEYCDNKFSVEQLEQLSEIEKEAEEKSDAKWDKYERHETGEETTEFICQSCGAAITGDDTMAATECPYCGNPVIIKQRIDGILRPDYVIPFKLDKAAAKKALSNHLCKKRLLPKVFKDQNHIDEVKGVYVPYWLFDADADANIKYHATKTRVWSDSDYDYTETKHFSILRGGTLKFENIPADGSSKMPDDLMESIEPFNMDDAVDFQTAYLAGFFADKYDIDASQTVERINERAKKTVESSFLSTLNGYDSVKTETSSISLNKSSVRYALLPVWILHTSWRGQNYIFARNGQTGKFVGNRPLD